MTEVTLRPYIDGRIPSRGASSRLLQEGRADVEVRFIELVGSGSARVYYPVESDNEIVAPCEGGRYFVDAVCPAVLGTDGRIARIFPPLEWVEGEAPLLVGDTEADRARVEQLQEEKNERFEAAQAAFDEFVPSVNQGLLDAQASADQAVTDAASALSAAAVAVVGNVTEYAVGSAAVAPTSGWSTAASTVPVGSFAWMRTVVTYGSGASVVTAPVRVQGDAGQPGSPGDPGVSVTSIVPLYVLVAVGAEPPSVPGGEVQ